MADGKAAVVLGAVVALIVGYAGVLAATTKFQPAVPDRSGADAFLNGYYAAVVDRSEVRGAWDNSLDEDFKRNLLQLRSVDEDDYTKFWAGYSKVDVTKTTQVSGTEGFSSQLVYTFKKTGKKSARETTLFTLRCPWWTAFTVLGCTDTNLKIHDSHTQDPADDPSTCER